MIRRTLVPFRLFPYAGAAEAKRGRRHATSLDGRIVVPQDLPVVPLDGESRIPAHVPLEVLDHHILIPRNMPMKPLVRPAEARRPASALDARVTVPPDARPAELKVEPRPAQGASHGLVAPDVLTSGEVNLIGRAAEPWEGHWGWQAVVSSVLFHAAFIALLLLQPRLFPYREPTPEEVELAHRSLGLVYVPPLPKDVLRAPPAAPPPAPKIRIDPRVFQRIAPPQVEASPDPGVGASEASRAQEQAQAPAAPAPPAAAAREEGEREAARFEPPPQRAEAPSGLVLQPSSPGRMLQDSIRDAARRGGTTGMEFSDALPGGPGGGLAGGGEGYAGGAVQILTPTEGVDFTNYIARMLASVRRNWYAVIPESARLGERGAVVLDFAVMRNGGVSPMHPELVRSSGREPLDRAAISAIRASNPFEPLPPAFSGPLVKFRFIFLYNMRLDQP